MDGDNSCSYNTDSYATAPCDSTPPYSSAYEPAPCHHVYGVTEPAPGHEQYYTSSNMVYMTPQPPKHTVHHVVQPGSQVVMVTAAPQAQRGCVCTAGWVLFGVGFAFPICWLVGVFLWLCTKNRHDKHAAIGSGVAIAVYAVALGLFLGLYVVPLTRMTFRAANDLAYNPYTYPTYYNNTWMNNPGYWNNPSNFNATSFNTTGSG